MRLDARVEPGHDGAVGGEQELLEVPLHVADPALLVGHRDQLVVDLVPALAVDVDLLGHREGDAVRRRAELGDLLGRPRLLAAELVARDTDDGEATVGVRRLELLQSGVLGSEPAAARNVDQEDCPPLRDVAERGGGAVQAGDLGVQDAHASSVIRRPRQPESGTTCRSGRVSVTGRSEVCHWGSCPSPVGRPSVPGDPPREGVVEFSDERRTISLPIRAALPVLTKAHARDDLHPSVGLLSGAALLALRLVAAGKFEPSGTAPHWRMGPLDAGDDDRVRMLAESRGAGSDGAEDVVRQVLDAVADAMPRSAPVRDSALARAGSRPARPTWVGATRPRLQERLAQRLAAATDDRPQLVRISLRVEADEEELVAGAVRLVLQVHDEQNTLHVCDAAELWTTSGPGGRPRVRRPRPHPRHHRAARGGRRLARPGPPARAAGARPDHPRRRRAGEPPRRRGRPRSRTAGSTCSGRAASVAT